MNRLRYSAGSAFVVALIGLGAPLYAQDGEQIDSRISGKQPGAVALAASGTIVGTVVDDQGLPLRGVMVAAVGGSSAFAVTDALGRFTLRALPAGAYVVRAHLAGFSPSRREIVEVKPRTKAQFSLSLRPTGPVKSLIPEEEERPRVLAAGFSPFGVSEQPERTAEAEGVVDDSELTWRLRHLRRSVLRQTTDVAGLLAAESEFGNGEDGGSLLTKALESSARFAATLFTEFPFSGQFNLLTTGSFDTWESLPSPEAIGRSVAYLSLGAAAGNHGDWAFEGAITQGDLASWIVAGSYKAQAPSAHLYSVGVSYSMQRYDGGNPVALAAVSDGSRNAGSVYGFDDWKVSRHVALSYGANYSRYDYLERAGLLSPKLGITILPADSWRLRMSVARWMLAPGAEEFVMTQVPGLWAPPERTFAPITPNRPFQAQSTRHFEIEVEHELQGSYVVGLRSFSQKIDHQLVALFGVEAPARPDARIGHYYVGNSGDALATGWGVRLSAALGSALKGSIDYAWTSANWEPSRDSALIGLLAPAAARFDQEKFHDLTTAVETEIPGTATRVFVVWKLNNAFARHDSATAPTFDTRFDVQLNQRLPFLNLSNADLEVLVAVRNFFRQATLDRSIYDELLVVNPPKRFVGGVLLRF
jgi:hypothetical protein